VAQLVGREAREEYNTPAKILALLKDTYAAGRIHIFGEEKYHTGRINLCLNNPRQTRAFTSVKDIYLGARIFHVVGQGGSQNDPVTTLFSRTISCNGNACGFARPIRRKILDNQRGRM
jgi:hypothetical protein